GSYGVLSHLAHDCDTGGGKANLSVAGCRALLPDDLDEHALTTKAIELAIEDLLPRAEIQPASRDGDDHFAPHDGPLQMGVRIVLVPIVLVLAVRFLWREMLEPFLKIAVQPALVV